jgi:hypothetical protein
MKLTQVTRTMEGGEKRIIIGRGRLMKRGKLQKQRKRMREEE